MNSIVKGINVLKKNPDFHRDLKEYFLLKIMLSQQ